jgi:hypothetical protein
MVECASGFTTMRPGSKQYECAYRFYAEIRTCRIEADSRAEAERFMNAIEWGPGCGPVGLPAEIEFVSWPVVKMRALAASWRFVLPSLANLGGRLHLSGHG